MADEGRLAAALTNLATLEVDGGAVDLALTLLEEALAIDRRLGNDWGIAVGRCNIAGALLRAGRTPQAHEILLSVLDDVVALGDVELLANTIELFAMAAATVDERLRAARLAGAAETIRTEAGMPLCEADAALLERFLAPARADAGRESWDRELAAGRLLLRDDAVALAKQSIPDNERSTTA